MSTPKSTDQVIREAVYTLHQFDDLNNMVTETCDLHEGKPIMFYCDIHDSVGCKVCMTENHRLCEDKIEYIANIVQNFNVDNKIIDLESKIDVQLLKFAQLRHEIQKENLLKEKESLLDGIKDVRAKFSAKLESMETSLSFKAERMMFKKNVKIFTDNLKIKAATMSLVQTKQRLKDQRSSKAEKFVQLKFGNACLNKERGTYQNLYSSERVMPCTVVLNKNVQKLIDDKDAELCYISTIRQDERRFLHDKPGSRALSRSQSVEHFHLNANLRRSGSCINILLEDEARESAIKKLIRGEEFVNWTKCVLALTTTRQAALDLVKEKFQPFVAVFKDDEVVIFLSCLRENKVKHLTQRSRTSVHQWKCEHTTCETILQTLLKTYSFDKKSLWTVDCGPMKQGITSAKEDADKSNWFWRIGRLYTESTIMKDAYDDLEKIDIAQLIKLHRNCQLFKFDGSDEIYDKILKHRNSFMHSTNNMVSNLAFGETFALLRTFLSAFTENVTSCESVLEQLKELQEATFHMSIFTESDKALKIKKEEVVSELRSADETRRIELQNLLSSTSELLGSLQAEKQKIEKQRREMEEEKRLLRAKAEESKYQDTDLFETPSVDTSAVDSCCVSGLSDLSSRDTPEKKNTGSKEQHFEIDDMLWQECITRCNPDDKRRAETLLESEYIPSQVMLDKLVQHFGRKTELTSAICDGICSYIKTKSVNIVDVWAALEPGTDYHVLIIIIVDKIVEIDIEYKHIKRLLGKVSSECKDITYSKEFDTALSDLSSDEKEKMRKCINSVNVDLMKKHKYLMMMSGSPLRSRGYGTSSYELRKETCIVLYVLVKGYIPIQEEPFKNSYEGLPVDVRESFFQLFTGTAEEYQEHMTHGCQILRHQLGTLGGFLDHHEYGICGITCGHVLLSPSEMKYLNNNAMDTEEKALNQCVYQPDSKDRGRNYLGKLVKAVYKEGGAGESGVDVALFQIEQRFPELGDFPTSRDHTASSLSYDSGNILKSNTTDKEVGVHKFGAVTDYTSGKAVLGLATLSVKTYQVKTEYEIQLHNLIEIRKSDVQERPFATDGDSGALVFFRSRNNDLYCVGIVEGGTGHDTCVAVPIEPILKEIGVQKFKSFRGNRPSKTPENKINALERKIDELQTNMLQNFQLIFQRLDGSGNARNTGKPVSDE